MAMESDFFSSWFVVYPFLFRSIFPEEDIHAGRTGGTHANASTQEQRHSTDRILLGIKMTREPAGGVHNPHVQV